MSVNLDELQRRLQYRFQDPTLLRRAMTHRSFAIEHNERLEFLGDAILGACVAELLYERLSALPEGDLSRVRANLVRQEALYNLAMKLGLSECLQLGEGEIRSGGKKRPSILADALEALIGAIYLDGGHAAARMQVRSLYEGLHINSEMAAIGKDSKTELQEWLQGRRMNLPSYRVVATLGEAHRQTFDVECAIAALGLVERGLGASRRAAEQSAAAAMLQVLHQRGA